MLVTVWAAENEIQTQKMINIIAIGSQNKALSLNSRKTGEMTVTKRQCLLKCNIKLNGYFE